MTRISTEMTMTRKIEIPFVGNNSAIRKISFVEFEEKETGEKEVGEEKIKREETSLVGSKD